MILNTVLVIVAFGLGICVGVLMCWAGYYLHNIYNGGKNENQDD